MVAVQPSAASPLKHDNVSISRLLAPMNELEFAALSVETEKKRRKNRVSSASAEVAAEKNCIKHLQAWRRRPSPSGACLIAAKLRNDVIGRFLRAQQPHRKVSRSQAEEFRQSIDRTEPSYANHGAHKLRQVLFVLINHMQG